MRQSSSSEAGCPQVGLSNHSLDLDFSERNGPESQGSFCDVFAYYHEALTAILDIFDNKSVSDTADVWEHFIDIILSFIPLDIARNVLRDRNDVEAKIVANIEEILNQHPDIDLGLDANYMAETLWGRHSDDFYLYRLKVNIIINFGIVNAFFKLLQLNYGAAFFSYRWILQFIATSRTICDKRAESLSSKRTELIIRQISLYLAKCLNLDYNQQKKIQYVSTRAVRINRLDMLKGILYNILENADNSLLFSSTVLQKYSIAQFFFICGEIYETISLLDGKIINYEPAVDLKTIAVVPQRTFSFYLVRHYILASAYFPYDDASKLLCYHKVLMGILLINKVDMTTFVFFHERLRETAKVLSPHQNCFTEYANFSLSGTFVNIIQLIANNSNKFQMLPFVCVRLNTSEVILDSDFSVGSTGNRHVCSKEAAKLKRKIFGADYGDDGSDLDESHTHTFIKFWCQINGV